MKPEVYYILIGVTKRVGKDTFSNLLADAINLIPGKQATRTSFAYELKMEVQRAFPNIDIFTEDEWLKENIVRPLLIAWGMARRHVDPDYWVKKVLGVGPTLAAAYKTSEPDCYINPDRIYVIVSDWRFPNEALGVSSKFPTTLAVVERPGVETTIREEMQNAPACRKMAHYIVNNDAGKDELKLKALELAGKIISR